MNTQYRKNLKAVAQACKDYTDKEIKASEERILSIVARNNVDFIDHTDEATYRFTAPANSKLLMLQSIAGNSVKYAPTTASDITTAYQKNVPSYSPSIDRASASMNILGGMSYKYNQLVDTNTTSITLVSGNKYFTQISGTNSVITSSGETISVASGDEVINLTQNYGSGNEPSDVATAIPLLKANGYKLDGTDEYDEGSIRDSAVTSIVSKDSNNTTIDTLSINASIQALTGYGQSNPDDATEYNYIDFNAKTFVRVGYIDNGVWVASALTTDISAYLDGNSLEIEPSGTLSFESTYSAYVPSNVSYNGVIKHALATAVKYESFNVWDEEVKNGYYSQGVYTNVSGSICSKNPIEVIGGSTYYFYYGVANIPYNVINEFDSNMNFIKEDYYYPNSAYQVSANCSYITFNIPNAYGTTYNNNICINISNQDLNGTYKPYKAPITRLLPNSEAKYSWGITNGVRNTRVFCDDECNPVNEGSLAVGNQDLGEKNWSEQSSPNQSIFRVSLSSIPNIKPAINNNTLVNAMISIYSQKTYIALSSSDNMCFAVSEYTSNRLSIINQNYNENATFKTAMSGVYLYYELATTATETLDDFDFSFDCEEGDTFTIIGCEQLQCYATYSFLIKEAKSNE